MTEPETTPAAEIAAPPAAEPAAEMVTLSKVEHDKILKALKDANAEAAKLRKAQDDKARVEMTEAEQLKADLASERTQRLTLLRETVASKHGLPDAFIGRLQGETREELEADAATLAAALPKPAPRSPGPVSGNPAVNPKLTRDQIQLMSTAEINARWAEVQEALKP